MRILKVYHNGWGFADHLSKNPTSSLIVLAQEHILAVYSLNDGQYLKKVSTEYYINAVRSIPFSSFVIAAGTRFLRIYNTEDSEYYSREEYILSYRSGGNIHSVNFSHDTGLFYVSGIGYVISLIVDEPTNHQCFDHCDDC